MKKQSYVLALLMILSSVAYPATPDNINAIQQSQIAQLINKVDNLQKQLTCVTQKTAASLSCRIVTQEGRSAYCNADEALTGGGVRNAWGVAVADSMPSGQSWNTASSDWNTFGQTSKGTTTYAVCCRSVANNLATLCPTP